MCDNGNIGCIMQLCCVYALVVRNFGLSKNKIQKEAKMPYNAKVYEILIASPSDVKEERELIKNTIFQWNSTNSKEMGIVLLPLMWETHSTPSLKDTAQNVINSQIVDNADILIGIFWTKLGTPTKNHKSGTAEEIERFVEMKKEILIYTSKKEINPMEIDLEQFKELKEFRQKMFEIGLLGEFSSISELKEKITFDLTRTIREITGKNSKEIIFERPVEEEKTNAIIAKEQITSKILEIQTIDLSKYTNPVGKMISGKGFFVKIEIENNFNLMIAKYKVMLKYYGDDEFYEANSYYSDRYRIQDRKVKGKIRELVNVEKNEFFCFAKSISGKKNYYLMLIEPNSSHSIADFKTLKIEIISTENKEYVIESDVDFNNIPYDNNIWKEVGYNEILAPLINWFTSSTSNLKGKEKEYISDLIDNLKIYKINNLDLIEKDDIEIMEKIIDKYENLTRVRTAIIR